VRRPFNNDLRDAKYNEIENATLTGTAALTAIGDDGNNYLTGNSGYQHADRRRRPSTPLDGKGGIDSLDGGNGNDVYYADNAGEKIIDTGGDAKDEVRAPASPSPWGPWTPSRMPGCWASPRWTSPATRSITCSRATTAPIKIDGVDGNDRWPARAATTR
jgi:Ca2+-binding RTX toxin-like protein